MSKVPNTGNPYAPSNLTWGVTRFLGIGAFGSAYVFLNKMWLGLALSSAFCLGVSLWYYVQNYSDSYIWALNCSLLACGPISMALSSVARVSNTLKDHILMSCLTGLALLACAVVVLAANPILLGLSLWCMLLFCIFQSRFHERGEITWTRYENALAILSICIALSAYLLIPAAPWLIVALLIAVHGVHCCVLWHVLRRQELSLEQHAYVWPRWAKNKSAEDFWTSFLFYCVIYNCIPSQSLKTTLVKIDIDILLAYFQPNKVLPSIKLMIPHHDLISAIKGRICTLDERAIVIFDMCSDDFQQAAQLVQDMRSGRMPANESIALPDLV